MYVRPTSTDGDSLAIREAIEAGAHVVATDVVRRPDECIIYPHGDVVAASSKILNVLNEKRIHSPKDLSQYGRMKDLYKELLGN